MQVKLEHRINIKFCVLNGIKPTETYAMLRTAYGENCLSSRTIFRWYSRFSDGRTSLVDNRHTGRPDSVRTEFNIQRVSNVINSDRRITVREISCDLHISSGTVHSILSEDLRMKRVDAKMVPRVLKEIQKDRRISVSRDMLHRLKTDPQFLSNIITGDESWVYGYDPETKLMSSQWRTTNEPRPKKARMSKSKIKSMIIIFFDISGIIHHEFVPHGKTVNSVYYLEVLQRLNDAVKVKRPEKQTGGWILHHDNAPVHTAKIVTNYIRNNNITILPQPPYSPDLAPSDFWIFFRIKKVLKGKRFQEITEIQKNTVQILHEIKEEEFKQCFENQWVKRWKKCILAGGKYFEGDKMNIGPELNFDVPVCETITDKVLLDHNYYV